MSDAQDWPVDRETDSAAFHIVVPVRDMPDHVVACIDALIPQLSPGDVVTVVDDGSSTPLHRSDFSGDVSIVRWDPSVGPYEARNRAASSSQQPFLLFLDSRCRPIDGLLDAHRELLSLRGVALSTTDIHVRTGRTLAERVAHLQQPFALELRRGVQGRLDWSPTANPGVRASVFREVGGFRDTRSGSDADFCWRVQEAGFGKMGADARPLMEWVPRDRWNDLVGQWRRYGESTAELEAEWPGQSTAAQSDSSSVARQIVARLKRLRLRDLAAPHVLLANLCLYAAYRRSYSRARRQSAEHVA